MRSTSLLAFACLAPLVSSVAGVAVAQAPERLSLARLRDRARPLLIFAPQAESAQMRAQLKALDEHAADVKERDVVVIALPAEGPSATPAKLTRAEAEAARQRFRVGPHDFVVVLIGKDGGEKLRAQRPLSVEKLKAVIDAMPMRQDEIRSRPR